MNGLAQFLKSKHNLSDEQAMRRAEWIMRQNAERAAEKKRKLEAAQLTLPLDGEPTGEEPTNKYEVTDEEIDF